MQTEGDELDLNVTKKTYKLIQTTKDLVTKENNFDPLIKLSIIVVQIIDKYIWSKEIIVHNTYLQTGFENWSSNIKEKETLKTRGNNSIWKSKWKPEICLQDNSVLLLPPIHRIKSKYNFWDISVVVKNDNEIIYENRSPDIREIIGGYQVNISPIKIKQPLGRLQYLLMSKNVEIYNSSDILYRDFIVFDMNGNEIKNNTDYKGTALFCTKDNLASANEYYKNEYYILSSSLIKYGDVFFVEDKIFNFTSLTRPGVFGEKFENHMIIKMNSRKKYEVYKKIKYLVFEDEKSSDLYEIVINSRSYKLSGFNYTITSKEGIDKYVIDLNLTEANIYTISVIKLKMEKRINVCTFNVAYDPKLMFSLSKITENNYTVSVNTGLAKNVITGNLDLNNFSIDDIQLKIGQEIYIYRIPLGIEMYKISSGAWKSLKDDIWIDDIRVDSVLDVYGLEIEGIMVCSSKGNVLDEYLPVKDKGVYKRVSISFLASYKNLYDYISIFLLKDQKVFSMIRCNNKCIIEEDGVHSSFDPIKSELSLTTQFRGEGSIYYEILDENGNKIFGSQPKTNNEVVTFQNLRSFEEYTINVFEKPTGLTLGGGNLLKTVHQTFYARKDFVGKSFKIVEMYYYKRVGKKLVEKMQNCNKNYIKITDKISDDIFIGQIYTKTSRGIYWLHKINPVEIEVNSDVISNAMDFYITKDGDGLLIDLKRNTILNDLDDFNAPSIEIYTISVKE